MTKIDEQMAGMRDRALPYEVKRDPDLWLCDDNAEFVAVIETYRQGIRNHDVNNAAYLMACANAAPALCDDIHRLRNELADAKETINILQHNINDDQDRLVHARALLACQEPVVAAAVRYAGWQTDEELTALCVAVREFEKGGAG